VTGPGGFGGAGMIWFAGDNLPEGISIDTTAGQAGVYVPTGFHHGAITTAFHTGNFLTGLVSPLKGFLFNNIRTTHTVCSNETDIILWGSHPKGGDGIYTYNWEISGDQETWSNAPGTPDQKDYLTNPSDTGKYFRRIVTSAGLAETSGIIHFRHYPPITNNTIEGGGTICSDVTADPILHNGPGLSGGTGTYAYSWQQFTLPSGWLNAGGSNNMPDYLPGFLQDTCLFRRIVISGKCIDTSNMVRFDVRQAPDITSQPADVSVKPGRHTAFSVTATGTSPVTYQWYFNDQPLKKATLPKLDVFFINDEDTGSYYCRISNVCGEINSNSARLTFIPTGLGQPEREGNIHVFPNPASERIFIEYGIPGSFEVQLYVVLGNRQNVWKQPEMIDVSNQLPGLYILKFLDEKKQLIKVFRIEVYR